MNGQWVSDGIHCYEDANYGKGMYAPCLRSKGHKGKHKHFLLCRNPSCVCGGFEAILDRHGYLRDWTKIRARIDKLQEELWQIEKKVK